MGDETQPAAPFALFRLVVPAPYNLYVLYRQPLKYVRDTPDTVGEGTERRGREPHPCDELRRAAVANEAQEDTHSHTSRREDRLPAGGCGNT